MIWDEQTSQLIDLIYDCVLHDGGWAPLMKALSLEFRCTKAFYFLHNADLNELLDGVYYQLEQEQQRRTQAIFLHQRRHLFEEYLLRPFRNDVTSTNPFISSSPHTDLHLWNEDRFRLLSTQPISSKLLVGLALHRSRDHEAFHSEHLQRLQMILLHLARALRIQRRIKHLESNAQNVVTALDSLPTPVMIVDENLQLLCSNQRAQDLLADTQSLSLKSDTFTLSCPKTRKDLLRAIQTTLATKADPTSPEVIKIRRPGKLPLKALPVLLNTSRPSRVMLLIYDPEANLGVDAGLLEELFDLTSTEAFVAARLAEGLSITEIADLRRCSPSTVRTHVKRLFQKTHTNRQGELVQLILTSPALSIHG